MLTPLAVVVSVILAVAVMASLAWPLVVGLRADRELNPGPDIFDSGTSDLGRLRQRRTAVLRMIQEVDAERALGNLNEDDHRTQRSGYVRRAATLIRGIEGREQVLDNEIERAIETERTRRRRGRPDTGNGRRGTG